LGAFARRLLESIMMWSVVFSLGIILPSLVQGQGVQVGVLPTLAHRVSGTLYVENNKTFFIENFNYDGAGPDAFLYYYPPGVQPDNRGNGLFIPISDTQEKFQLGVSFTNVPFRFNLPEGVYACHIGTFTIWCRAARQFFTRIEIPSTIFTNSSVEAQSRTDVILCAPGTGTPPGSGTLQTVSFASFSLVAVIITVFFFSY